MAKMKTIYKHLLTAFLFLGNVCFLQAQLPGNFTTLQSLITGTAANGTLTLDKDYVATASESRLTISKNITIDLNGHIVNRNLTESKAKGNVFYVNSNVNLTIKDSRPTATHTPAVTYTNPITSEEKTIVGGIIMGGNTDEDGGGIMVTNGGRLTMNGGSIANNRSVQGGGGVFNSGNATFTMTGGAIVGNMAGSYDDNSSGNGYGGGVCNGGTNNSSLAQFIMTGGIIAGNTAKLYGGGVYNNVKAHFVMRNSEISENEANSKNTTRANGGGVHNTGLLEIDHGVVSGNRALSDAFPTTQTHGGGIYGEQSNNDSLVMVITDSEITNNEAYYGGGGLYVRSNNRTRILLTGNTFQENKVKVAGGGFAVVNQGTSRLLLKNCLFTGNEANTGGGGFHIDGGNKGMTIEIGNNRIKGNTANYGAGLHFSNTTLEMHNDSISNNMANSHGGGVCIGNTSTFIMKEGLVISGNTARQGGGVYVGRGVSGSVQYATAELDGALIANNRADSYGGGVYTSKNTTFNIKSGAITGNTASQYGGGVCCGEAHNNNYNSTLNMTDGLIADNTASWGGGRIQL